MTVMICLYNLEFLANTNSQPWIGMLIDTHTHTLAGIKRESKEWSYTEFLVFFYSSNIQFAKPSPITWKKEKDNT